MWVFYITSTNSTSAVNSRWVTFAQHQNDFFAIQRPKVQNSSSPASSSVNNNSNPSTPRSSPSKSSPIKMNIATPPRSTLSSLLSFRSPSNNASLSTAPPVSIQALTPQQESQYTYRIIFKGDQDNSPYVIAIANEWTVIYEHWQHINDHILSKCLHEFQDEALMPPGSPMAPNPNNNYGITINLTAEDKQLLRKILLDKICCECLEQTVPDDPESHNRLTSKIITLSSLPSNSPNSSPSPSVSLSSTLPNLSTAVTSDSVDSSNSLSSNNTTTAVANTLVDNIVSREAINLVLKKGLCSSTITGFYKYGVHDILYMCKDCSIGGKGLRTRQVKDVEQAVCRSCASLCHFLHEIIPFKTNDPWCCDCGGSQTQNSKCLALVSKISTNPNIRKSNGGGSGDSKPNSRSNSKDKEKIDENEEEEVKEPKPSSSEEEKDINQNGNKIINNNNNSKKEDYCSFSLIRGYDEEADRDKEEEERIMMNGEEERIKDLGAWHKVMYMCRTCSIGGLGLETFILEDISSAICLSCATTCHRGHEVLPFSPVNSTSLCSCGLESFTNEKDLENSLEDETNNTTTQKDNEESNLATGDLLFPDSLKHKNLNTIKIQQQKLSLLSAETKQNWVKCKALLPRDKIHSTPKEWKKRKLDLKFVKQQETNGQCTFSTNDNNHKYLYHNLMYVCHTCKIKENELFTMNLQESSITAAICATCASHCHRGHKLTAFSPFEKWGCDCEQIKQQFGTNCKCPSLTPEDSPRGSGSSPDSESNSSSGHPSPNGSPASRSSTISTLSSSNTSNSSYTQDQTLNNFNHSPTSNRKILDARELKRTHAPYKRRPSLTEGFTKFISTWTGSEKHGKLEELIRVLNYNVNNKDNNKKSSDASASSDGSDSDVIDNNHHKPLITRSSFSSGLDYFRNLKDDQRSKVYNNSSNINTNEETDKEKQEKENNEAIEYYKVKIRVWKRTKNQNDPNNPHIEDEEYLTENVRLIVTKQSLLFKLHHHHHFGNGSTDNDDEEEDYNCNSTNSNQLVLNYSDVALVTRSKNDPMLRVVWGLPLSLDLSFSDILEPFSFPVTHTHTTIYTSNENLTQQNEDLAQNGYQNNKTNEDPNNDFNSNNNGNIDPNAPSSNNGCMWDSEEEMEYPALGGSKKRNDKKFGDKEPEVVLIFDIDMKGSEKKRNYRSRDLAEILILLWERKQLDDLKLAKDKNKNFNNNPDHLHPQHPHYNNHHHHSNPNIITTNGFEKKKHHQNHNNNKQQMFRNRKSKEQLLEEVRQKKLCNKFRMNKDWERFIKGNIYWNCSLEIHIKTVVTSNHSSSSTNTTHKCTLFEGEGKIYPSENFLNFEQDKSTHKDPATLSIPLILISYFSDSKNSNYYSSTLNFTTGLTLPLSATNSSSNSSSNSNHNENSNGINKMNELNLILTKPETNNKQEEIHINASIKFKREIDAEKVSLFLQNKFKLRQENEILFEKLNLDLLSKLKPQQQQHQDADENNAKSRININIEELKEEEKELYNLYILHNPQLLTSQHISPHLYSDPSQFSASYLHSTPSTLFLCLSALKQYNILPFFFILPANIYYMNLIPRRTSFFETLLPYPTPLRPFFWSFFGNSSALLVSLSSPFLFNTAPPLFFYTPTLDSQKFYEMLKVSTPPGNKVIGEIEKDVCRTFPEWDYFQGNYGSVNSKCYSSGGSTNGTGNGSSSLSSTSNGGGGSSKGIESMRQMLEEFGGIVKRVGYCQGLNFVAGFLLLILGDLGAMSLSLLIQFGSGDNGGLVGDYYDEDMIGIQTDRDLTLDLMEVLIGTNNNNNKKCTATTTPTTTTTTTTATATTTRKMNGFRKRKGKGRMGVIVVKWMMCVYVGWIKLQYSMDIIDRLVLFGYQSSNTLLQEALKKWYLDINISSQSNTNSTTTSVHSSTTSVHSNSNSNSNSNGVNGVMLEEWCNVKRKGWRIRDRRRFWFRESVRDMCLEEQGIYRKKTQRNYKLQQQQQQKILVLQQQQKKAGSEKNLNNNNNGESSKNGVVISRSLSFPGEDHVLHSLTVKSGGGDK